MTTSYSDPCIACCWNIWNNWSSTCWWCSSYIYNSLTKKYSIYIQSITVQSNV